MRLTLIRRCVVTGAAVLTVLAGCLPSVAQKMPKYSVTRPGVVAGPRVFHHPFVSPALVGLPSTIAISDFGNNDVNVYDDSGNLMATLTSGLSNPQGMASDRKGNLYIANTGAGNISVWAAGFNGPPTTWDDSGQFPADVDVRNNGGFGAATNIFAQNGGPGSVTLYRNGNNIANVADPSVLEAFFCAFDKTGNLYFDGFDANGAIAVWEIAHANTGGRTVQELTYNATILFPGGVQVTNDGHIAIQDQSGFQILTFNPPVNGSLGTPTATTPLTGAGDPVTFAFKKFNHHLYTADAALLDSNEYPYPAGGSPENTISISGASLPIGTAVIPTQMP